MSMNHEFIKTEGNKHEMMFPNKTEPRKNYACQNFRKITEESKAWKENIYISFIKYYNRENTTKKHQK